MDAKLREQLLERLSYRAARLARITSADHPGRHIDTIVAMQARHVAETAMVLLGESFARELFSETFDAISEGFSICRFCHARPLRSDRTMCQVCWDQAASDDAITDEELRICVAEAEDSASEDKS